MYLRAIKPHIIKSLENYPVVILTGARKVGKSILAYEFVKERKFDYISLDNIEQRKLAIEDPKYFLQQFNLPLIIDEVQYAPILFEVIEEIVNKKRLQDGSANGIFLLTASQAFHLMKDVPTKERIQHYPNRKDFTEKEVFEIITKGMYPELYKDHKQISDYYENYVNTYIDRDIIQILLIATIVLNSFF